MEVKIGVQHAPRELVVDTDETAGASRSWSPRRSPPSGVLTLTDTKGRRIARPAAKLAYVEIGHTGQVGFRS